MTKLLTPSEVAATHRERPTSKAMTPFTVEPGNNGRVYFMHSFLGLDGKMNKTPWYIIRTDPVAAPILALQSMYFAVEAERDGHLKQIDELTTENLLLKRQIEETANKARYAERKKENGK